MIPAALRTTPARKGRNVWVSVYYNLEMMDPLYTTLVKGHQRREHLHTIERQRPDAE